MQDKHLKTITIQRSI